MSKSASGSRGARTHLAAAVFALVAVSAASFAQPAAKPGPLAGAQPPVGVQTSPPPELYGPWPIPAEPAPLPPLTPARAVAVPERPEDPRQAKVYGILETHCSRCHQAGKTAALLPSGGLGDILDLDRLARDPALVRPKLPDASRLYDVLITRHAPLDVYQPGAEDAEPRPEDIQAVREWIRDIPSMGQTCSARKPAPRDRIAEYVREAQRLERDGASDLRFISIAHLYNGCATDAELAGYRQALNKALNSVSRAPAPIKLAALDPEGLAFSIRLADFGWRQSDWERIAREAPPTPALSWPADINSRAATKLPIAPADWFVAVVSEPPLYYDLLGVPAKLADLGRANGVDIDQDIRLGAARRAAARVSAVTRGNRLVERHAGANGGFWLTYDFATSEGDQDVFQRPLGPKTAALNASSFKPDMIRASFALPNGFFGFALYDAAGNRIDRALPGVEKSYTGAEALASDSGAKAGANCFACHVDAVIGMRDSFRSFASAEPSPLPPDARETALKMFPGDVEMALLVAGDVERYTNALAAAGVDAALRNGADEPVTALAKRYRRPVGFDAALTETGLLRDAFVLQLAEATGQAAPLARRLQQGVLPRPDLNKLYALLKGANAPAAAPSGGFLRDVETEIGLSLRLDPPRPLAGDLVTVTAESDADCYLTIISVDAKSKATVIYPNDFETDYLLPAGKTLTVPGPEAPYQLRFRALGPETILARCSTSPKPPMGIEHDFQRQRFTALGNWEVFIHDTLLTDSEMRNNPEKAQRAEAARADALRRSGAAGLDAQQRTETMPGLSLRDGRAVLVISVN
ncbi:MAG: DUF4384 domain-containing protein [Hyphomicrobium sp.]